MRVAMWCVVACAVLSAIGLFVPSFELHVGGYRLRRRAYVAAAIALVAAIVAIAIHVACRRVRFEANDDLGHDAIVLAGGVWLILLPALGGLAAAIVYGVRAHRMPTLPRN